MKLAGNIRLHEKMSNLTMITKPLLRKALVAIEKKDQYLLDSTIADVELAIKILNKENSNNSKGLSAFIQPLTMHLKTIISLLKIHKSLEKFTNTLKKVSVKSSFQQHTRYDISNTEARTTKISAESIKKTHV